MSPQRQVKAPNKRRHFDLIEERKKLTYSTWHSMKGEGEANAFLGKEQMEEKSSKVEKHRCGCCTKPSKAMVFFGARDLKGKENRDHITRYSKL